jgi:hypothetical protein
MDSQTAVDALYRVDPGFTALCETLLGDAVDAREVWSYVYGQEPVVKMSPDSADISVKRGLGNRKRKGKLKPARTVAMNPARQMQSGDGFDIPTKGSSVANGYSVTKAENEDSFGVTWVGEFSKMDDDKRQVFGWASVVEVDGRPVVDRQGDWITPDEIEKAAYEYVVKSRVGGHQHKRTDNGAFHASDMIESIVFTPEKIAKMGLPDDFPVGWWVGYKVHDDETWTKVKKGDITGFSIHGKGKRQSVEI